MGKKKYKRITSSDDDWEDQLKKNDSIELSQMKLNHDMSVFDKLDPDLLKRFQELIDKGLDFTPTKNKKKDCDKEEKKDHQNDGQ